MMAAQLDRWMTSGLANVVGADSFLKESGVSGTNSTRWMQASYLRPPGDRLRYIISEGNVRFDGLDNRDDCSTDRT